MEAKERVKLWRENNKEKKKEYDKEYYLKNSKSIIESVLSRYYKDGIRLPDVDLHVFYFEKVGLKT